MKAVGQYFPAVLFNYKVVFTFEYVGGLPVK